MISSEIVPDVYSLIEADVEIVAEAIASCCHKLTEKNLKWVNAEGLEVEDFCCSFVVSCCSKIQIECQSLQWIPKHAEILKFLTKLYRIMVKQRVVSSTSLSPTSVCNQLCIK